MSFEIFFMWPLLQRPQLDRPESTLILAKSLTVDPFNCWPLKLRMSVCRYCTPTISNGKKIMNSRRRTRRHSPHMAVRLWSPLAVVVEGRIWVEGREKKNTKAIGHDDHFYPRLLEGFNFALCIHCLNFRHFRDKQPKQHIQFSLRYFADFHEFT